MSDIILHPRPGVNPRMTVCPQCGTKGQELVLLGRLNHIRRCSDCGINTVGEKCPKCQRGTEIVRELFDSECVAGSLCEMCKHDRDLQAEEVKKGGVYFKCESCGTQGVIKAGHGMSEAVRKYAGIAAPLPVGVNLKDCPKCHKIEGPSQTP